MLKPSRKELKISRKAFQEADPTTYVSLGGKDMKYIGVEEFPYYSTIIYENDSEERFSLGVIPFLQR